MRWMSAKLKEEYETKAEILGPEPETQKEAQRLNRTLRWKYDRIEYEADSRHAEIII